MIAHDERLEPRTPEAESRVTDSLWFWAPIFIVGAMVALLLTQPKYSWRQPQIERQFQARERAGQSISAHGGYSRLSTTGNAMLTLRPLLIFFSISLFILTFCFWLSRLARLRHRQP